MEEELQMDWLPTAEEVEAWAQLKHDNLPTLTGSPEWQRFMHFIERKLNEYGVVDVVHNRWQFERWTTTEDNRGWSLEVNGEAVRVAYYGAYSGGTGPAGITKPLVYYDHSNPPSSIKNKIVVIPTKPHPQPPYDEDYIAHFTFNDYEYRTEDESFPPLFEAVDPADSITFDSWWQLCQELHEIAIEGEAAGAVILYDMSFERSEGLFTFPVPEPYDCPLLIVDRDAGRKLAAHALAGQSATLRLESVTEPAEAYQLIAYLPGNAYGTPSDEQILLTTHTDGPSITQDNGVLGLLAIVGYFSHLPQQSRRRSLMIHLDCRHYLPGMEEVFHQHAWFTKRPETADKLVSLIHIEHLGELDFREVGNRVIPTGNAEQSYLWVRNNQRLIDAAIAAVKATRLARVQVVAPERLGIHGRRQQLWWGLGNIAMPKDPQVVARNRLDLPGFGFGSFLGYYWTSKSGIDRWSRELTMQQIVTMTRLANLLMHCEPEIYQLD